MKVITITLLSLYLLVCFSISIEYTYKYAKVVSIGGCNRNGYCGVLLDNGIFTNVSYPVVGKDVIYERTANFNWKWRLL